MRSIYVLGWLKAGAVLLCATVALAEPNDRSHTAISFNGYGEPGLVDMPVGQQAPDATLSATIGRSGATTKTTLRFQITPKLSGSFRYAAIGELIIPGSPEYQGHATYYDRSFDLRYQVWSETDKRPALTLGLQDFMGTGLYGGEYVVASKTLSPRLTVSTGLGWGRLGSYRPIGHTGRRPDHLIGQGGIPTYDRWFRGPVAAFGGLSWRVHDRVNLKLEYSSDAYLDETTSGLVPRKTPWNVGVEYKFKRNAQLSLALRHGAEVGAHVTLSTNPKQAANPSGYESAPLPVQPRPTVNIQDLGWHISKAQPGLNARINTAFAQAGLIFEGMTLSHHAATIRMRNPTYGTEPQALGRAWRILTRIMPPSVETFTLIPTSKGQPLAAITAHRRDLETLEFAPSAELLDAVTLTDMRDAPAPHVSLYPATQWSFAPYVTFSVFDPDNPIRADAGVRLAWTYQPAAQWEVAGAVTKKIGGNLDATTRVIPSGLPRVRTDYARYSRRGDPALEYLTFSHFERPFSNAYSRISFGYLEPMFAGVSAELLWKPVNSAFAAGLQLSAVQQRAFRQGFGLRPYKTVTGHVSLYQDFGNGFHGQADIGRFLAGDDGIRLSVDREFANGWRVGAFASFTNVAFDDFGEGSFDKGIRITVPLDWALGKSTRRKQTVAIQSLTRDGAAMLQIRDRLYPRVRAYHRAELAKSWGRVWR